MDVSTLGAWLVATFNTVPVKMVVVLLFCNVISGIAVALYKGVFNLGDTAMFLRTRALPYLLGGAVLKLAVLVVGSDYGLTPQVADLVWAFAILALVGHIIENLREVGLQVPGTFGSPRSDSVSPPVPPHVPA